MSLAELLNCLLDELLIRGASINVSTIQQYNKNATAMPDFFSTYYQSPVGLLKITGAENFISEILFIDNIEKPQGDNKKKLPLIIINCIEQLIQYFNGERRTFDFALNQNGTEFQKKVWNELQGIPFGKTISYLELSRRLGDTKVIRAAASANGKNSISIVVPCHRVIGSKNDLVGYAGGIWRKDGCLSTKRKWRMACRHFFSSECPVGSRKWVMAQVGETRLIRVIKISTPAQ